VPENSPRIFNNDWQDTDAASIRQPASRLPIRASPPSCRRSRRGVHGIVRGRTPRRPARLVEVYDLAPETNARFGNLSSRGRIAPGENNVMMAA
jgi:hypothetical protein